MVEPLGILDLLRLRGFDPAWKTKFLRHQDDRYDLRELINEGWFDAYQCTQRLPVLKGRDVAVVFLGEAGSRARFHGVYRVLGCQPTASGLVPPGCPYPEWYDQGRYLYDLEKIGGFGDLEGRVIVSWGRSTRSWHQNARNKEVLEIRPRGEVLEPFSDYLEFILTHDELCALYRDPEAHREWRARLTAIAGVYLIHASTTGQLYVGSAYGAEGLWGRWNEYARNGHGGNAALRALLQRDPDYPGAFRFSLLQVLPKTTARHDVIAREVLFKHKLGTRAVGLNSN